MAILNVAPIPLLRALGDHTSHPPNVSITSTPQAAAVRMRVPILPGSEMLSRRRTREGLAGIEGLNGRGINATTPCGVTVSLMSRIRLVDPMLTVE